MSWTTTSARLSFLLSLAVVGIPASSAPVLGQSSDALIAAAVQAAPEHLRAEAQVIAFDGRVTSTLRAGTNGIICLAPDPNADRFNAACYHESMEPYMERGRALRVEGVTEGGERNRIRWEEADAGTLAMPEKPASLYILAGPADVWDPATGEVDGASLRWVVYTPWATGESTGLSEIPVAGGPWLMFPGTPGAHIMVTPIPPQH